MKNSITLLTALSLAFIFNSANSYGQTTTSVNSPTPCYVGDSISVNIEVGQYIGVGAISLSIMFDNTVLQFGNVTDINAQVPALLAGSIVNRVNIAWSSLTSANITSGTLCVLRFKYFGGNTNLTYDISNCEITDAVANPIMVSYSNGSVTLNTLPGPPVPTVTQNANSLVSTIAASYQWYLNGIPVSGATQQTITPSVSGNYQVEVFDQNGCKEISNPFPFFVLGVEDASGINWKAIISPDGKEILISGLSKAKKVQLINAAGKEVYSNENMRQGTHSINIDGMAAGVYLVTVASDKKTTTQRISISR
jgi:hypothetical protein